MDTEHLKHTTILNQDQLDMMLMMQMDKLPEFSGSYTDASDMPSADFVLSSTLNNYTDNIGAITPHANSSSLLINFPTNNISFSCATNQIQEPTPAGFVCNSTSEAIRWKSNNASGEQKPSDKKSSMAAMREMIFRIAAMQPIHIDPESVKPPKRRNVKISKDPQSVAARHRRERISERIRILQRLVPGGTKMDTASMLDEAIHYVKFLKSQVQYLERAAVNRPTAGLGFPVAMSSGSYFPFGKVYQPQNVQHFHGDA